MSNLTVAPSVASTPAQPSPPTKAHIRLNVQWLRTHGAKLKPSPFKVYTALVARMGRNPTAWPSHEILAADTGLSVATVKRALKSLADAELVGWNPRFEPTKRGKMRQTSNGYFFKQIDPPSPVKAEPGPSLKESHKTVEVDSMQNETDNGVVEDANSSPVLDATDIDGRSAEEMEQWRQMLIGARLTARDALKYAGPDVPRVIAWWETVNKLNLRGVGLLITRLKDPSLLPMAPAPVEAPDVQNAGSRADYHEDAPRLSIDELRARATAQVAACLALMEPLRREKLEICIAGFEFVSQKKDYLSKQAPVEWARAGETLAERMH